MRLIDADALTNHIKDELCFPVECEECTFFQPYDKECILKIWVDNAPAIDTEDIEMLNYMKNFVELWTRACIGCTNTKRRGKWIYDTEAYPLGNPYGHYDCDQCGESVPDRTNFCPNCGAKMDGERGEGRERK